MIVLLPIMLDGYAFILLPQHLAGVGGRFVSIGYNLETVNTLRASVRLKLAGRFAAWLFQ